MEHLFQQLIDQQIRTNDLLAKQQEMMQVQKADLNMQQQKLDLMVKRMERIEDLQLQMAEILDRDLLSFLEQPLLFKQDVMEKLDISDATFRNYVADEKLKPMKLGKTEYFFPRDLAKDLLASKIKKK